MHKLHKENICLFREANSIEKAFRKQFDQAIPELYLLPYRDTITNTTTTPLQDILSQLIQTYSSISDEELEE